MKHILGVRRSPEFSPNSTGYDSAIFSLTVAELESKGFKVRQLTEEEFFHAKEIDEEIIFSMIRNRQNVEKLKQLEQEGKTVINSGYGIENCFRANMTDLLLENEIPHPKSWILSTSADAQAAFEDLGDKHIWIKRGDFHTVHKEDIAFCRNAEEGNSIMKEFALREIPSAVLSQHLTGDLVKFYAVEGTPFFHWFYPFEANHLMFGSKTIEETRHYDFDLDELKSIASRAANVLDIKIYGGDAVISKNREIQLIDVNDWPSFAPCRDEAAKYIAETIIKKGIENK